MPIFARKKETKFMHVFFTNLIKHPNQYVSYQISEVSTSNAELSSIA